MPISSSPTSASAPPGPCAPALFWLALAAAFIPLGVNKQLDLQILARRAAIDLVTAAGFGPHQQWVGRGLVALLALAALILLPLAVRRLGPARRDARYRLAFAGVALLGAFIVLRAGMYMPVLKQLNNAYKDAIHLGLELGGLLLVGLAAVRVAFPRRRPHSAPEGRKNLLFRPCRGLWIRK